MWTHKKYRPTKKWKGNYEKLLSGDRVLCLVLQGKLPKNVDIIERVYDSWQAAKEAGWSYHNG